MVERSVVLANVSGQLRAAGLSLRFAAKLLAPIPDLDACYKLVSHAHDDILTAAAILAAHQQEVMPWK